MKSNYLLITGIFIFAIASIILGIYTMTQLSEVSEISFEIREASDIAILALDFNVENFHTQLEAWEYAYEPTEERLSAFESHDRILTDLLNKLVEEVEEEAEDHRNGSKEISALTKGGELAILQIVEDLEKVRNDWKNMFASIDELRDLYELGYDDIDSEGHKEFFKKRQNVDTRVYINEALFDALEFNKEIDKFVEDQKSLVFELQSKQRRLIERFSVLFFILIVVFILFNIIAALSLMKIFKKKKRK